MKHAPNFRGENETAWDWDPRTHDKTAKWGPRTHETRAWPTGGKSPRSNRAEDVPQSENVEPEGPRRRHGGTPKSQLSSNGIQRHKVQNTMVRISSQ